MVKTMLIIRVSKKISGAGVEVSKESDVEQLKQPYVFQFFRRDATMLLFKTRDKCFVRPHIKCDQRC